jgi:hypothetical protein
MSETIDRSVLELLWRPWALPEVAIRMSETRAERIAAAGIGAIVGIIGGHNVVWSNADVWSERECLTALIVTGLCCGVMGTLIATFVVRLWTTAIGQDLTTELQRAKRRAFFLLPVCALLPFAAWSICSIGTFRLARGSGGIPLHQRFVALLGDWPTLLGLALIALTFLYWARQRIGIQHQKDVCFHCGYSLVGVTEPRCPECGNAFDPAKIAHLTRAAMPAAR